MAAAEPQELKQFHSEQRAAIDFLVLAKAQVHLCLQMFGIAGSSCH